MSEPEQHQQLHKAQRTTQFLWKRKIEMASVVHKEQIL